MSAPKTDTRELYAAAFGGARRYVEREEVATIFESLDEHLEQEFDARDEAIADLRREIDILKARRACSCGALARARPSFLARAWAWLRSLVPTSEPR